MLEGNMNVFKVYIYNFILGVIFTATRLLYMPQIHTAPCTISLCSNLEQIFKNQKSVLKMQLQIDG